MRMKVVAFVPESFELMAELNPESPRTCGLEPLAAGLFRCNLHSGLLINVFE